MEEERGLWMGLLLARRLGLAKGLLDIRCGWCGRKAYVIVGYSKVDWTGLDLRAEYQSSVVSGVGQES